MSSWLKLVREVERGSEGGTDARDGEVADIFCVSLGGGAADGREDCGDCGESAIGQSDPDGLTPGR